MKTPVFSSSARLWSAFMAGDALGSPAEFCYRDDIISHFPHGLRKMVPGFGTLIDREAGVVTDDTQMAACLQRALVRADGYDPDIAREEYLAWLATDPPDVGETVKDALEGRFNLESQANGALMRAFPIALWAEEHPQFDWENAALQDAALTHPHPTCLLANYVFTGSLVFALAAARKGRPASPQRVLRHALALCKEKDHPLDPSHPSTRAVEAALRASRHRVPDYDGECIGWVLVTLQGAFYQLLHAPSLRTAITRSASAGGDTDTNAATAAVLYAATFPDASLPATWLTTLRRRNPEYAHLL